MSWWPDPGVVSAARGWRYQTESGLACLGSNKVFYNIPLLATSTLCQTQTIDLLVFACQRRSSYRYLPYANLHSQAKSRATRRVSGSPPGRPKTAPFFWSRIILKHVYFTLPLSIFRRKIICKGQNTLCPFLHILGLNCKVTLGLFSGFSWEYDEDKTTQHCKTYEEATGVSCLGPAGTLAWELGQSPTPG